MFITLMSFFFLVRGEKASQPSRPTSVLGLDRIGTSHRTPLGNQVRFALAGEPRPRVEPLKLAEKRKERRLRAKSSFTIISLREPPAPLEPCESPVLFHPTPAADSQVPAEVPRPVEAHMPPPKFGAPLIEAHAPVIAPRELPSGPNNGRVQPRGRGVQRIESTGQLCVVVGQTTGSPALIRPKDPDPCLTPEIEFADSALETSVALRVASAPDAETAVRACDAKTDAPAPQTGESESNVRPEASESPSSPSVAQPAQPTEANQEAGVSVRARVPTLQSTGASVLLKSWKWICTKHAIRAGKRMRLEESVSLGEKRIVALIEVEGRRFLIGGGSSGVSLLTQLDAEPDFQTVVRKKLESN